jgi:EAL domain-containing protein (putative c-di-GMP-specific phosphodiesterase class I)
MDKKIAHYITSAIEHGTLEIQYQPQFEFCEDHFIIAGAEALLRPDTKICHLEKLISVAVESNQIIELGYWIIEEVASQIRDWIDSGVVSSSFSVSVNVAPEQLHDELFCYRVTKIMHETEIDPEQITLELTESAMIDDEDIAKVHKLTQAGFNISIDDFGTGYSSLSRLKYLPVHEIKIDKAFVDDITKTQQDVALVTAIYQLTQALNKFTVVEGVETSCQYHILRDIGFTNFQGFYFSEALCCQKFVEIIKLVGSLHCQ